jgi:hypothetical protein
MKKIVWISLFSFVLAVVPAHAKIYKWVDEKGKVHFTDNPSKIPKKQGSKIKILKEAPPPVQNKVSAGSTSSNKPEQLLNELGNPSGLKSEGENNGLPQQFDEKQIESIQEQLESFQETYKESQESREQRLKVLKEVEGSRTKPRN